MSNEIKTKISLRVPKVIKKVPGADTFKPKVSVKARYKTHDLKRQSTDRLIALIKYGSQADKLTHKVPPITNKADLSALNFHNELASTPHIVQFYYWVAKHRTLREELDKLLLCDNQRKIDLHKPTIDRQLDETEIQIRELAEVIQAEKKIISRKVTEKE